MKPKDFRQFQCVPNKSALDPDIPYSELTVEELSTLRDLYGRCALDFLAAWSAASKELYKKSRGNGRGKRGRSG